MEIILIIISIVICIAIKSSVNTRVDNYDMRKVSIGKMALDAGKSKAEIKRNLVSGKYDKDDKFVR